MSDAIEFLSANYRTDLDIWVCRWFEIASPEHFITCYNYIFDQAITHKWHQWLVDVRGRGIANEAQQDWYFNTFLPKKVQQLTGSNFLAYLITPSHFAHIKKMSHFYKFGDQNTKSTLTTHFFQSEDAAFNWLQQSHK